MLLLHLQIRRYFNKICNNTFDELLSHIHRKLEYKKIIHIHKNVRLSGYDPQIKKEE